MDGDRAFVGRGYDGMCYLCPHFNQLCQQPPMVAHSNAIGRFGVIGKLIDKPRFDQRRNIHKQQILHVILAEAAVFMVMLLLRDKTKSNSGETSMNNSNPTTNFRAIYSTNAVVRQTYMLLSMTLLTSAAAAWLSMSLQLGAGSSLLFSLVGLGMIFFLRKAANSPWALFFVFAFTAIEGLSLGPVINHYLQMTNGANIVMQALGGTAAIFLILSAYTLTSKKDFSFLGGFLFTGLIIVIVTSIVGMFFNIPGMQLAIAAASVLIFSGLILFDTSRIIQGGETNYVVATVSLYLDILNLFLSLLRLLSNRN